MPEKSILSWIHGTLVARYPKPVSTEYGWTIMSYACIYLDRNLPAKPTD